MRILITGGAGFIGSHLAEFLQDNAEIIILDNLRSGYSSNLAGIKHTFINGSITDPSDVALAMKNVDIVFHLAALISVPESIAKPLECLEINGRGLLIVLEEAAKAGVRKFVLASSAAVYGDNPVVPKTEDMRPEPKSPYAVTKLDGEHYLEIYRKEWAIDTASLRFFNVFGPRQDPNSPYAAAVPIFIRKALAGEDIPIFGDGHQTRDFIHVKDIVAALQHVAFHPGLSGTYNVGYGKSMTVLDLAKLVITSSDSNSRIIHLPERPGDVRHSRASPDRLLETGFRPVSSIAQGLADTLAHLEIHS